MNRQWVTWRSYAATEALGLNQELVRPVIEQVMLEAMETERSEHRAVLTKAVERLTAIAADLDKITHATDAAGELRQFAELFAVIAKQLTEVESEPDAEVKA